MDFEFNVIVPTYLQVGVATCQVRWLNLQEYQSKKLMADCGITVQQFKVASTPAEAASVAKQLSESSF